MGKLCPHCKLISPDDAIWCDCGYDFTTERIKESHGRRVGSLDKVNKNGGASRTTLVYFRASLAVPIVMPILLLLAERSLPKGRIMEAADYFALTVVYGGVPYLALALYIFLWLKGKSERQIINLAWLSPIIFIPIEAIAWIIYSLYLTRSGPGSMQVMDVFWVIVMAAAFILPFGYFYVAIVLSIYQCCKQAGLIRTDEPTLIS